MLEWFRKLLFVAPGRAPAAAATSLARVSHDELTIKLAMPGHAAQRIAWDSIARVVIETTDKGPRETDLFWRLLDSEGHGLCVPMGAEGEHDLMLAMQRRLEGFDNMAVIEAMGSTEKARFEVWRAEP